MGGFLKCFGTGPGKSEFNRNFSAYLYRFDQTGIIVDCGEPFTLSFRRAGEDPDGFEALLLSHTHPDHIGSFLSFMQLLKHRRRSKPLDIHLPGHAIPALKGLLDAAYVFPERLTFSFEFQKLEAGRTFSIRGVKVTPFHTSHLDEAKAEHGKLHPVPFEAFSFLFKSPERTAAHSGDIGSEADVAPLLQEKLDLLVVELAHADPRALFSMIGKAGAKKACFVHLKDLLWKKRPQLRKEAAAIIGRTKLFFPLDGSRIRF